jgi:ABC-type dipeptide/oligopeptide/nickel transport system permease component
MAFVTLFVTIGYVWLLKICTKPLLYTSMLIIFVLGVACGYYAYKETLKYEDKTSSDYKMALTGAIVIWVIVLVYSIFICCFWRQIALGASIMEAASEFLTSNKKVVLLPAIAYLMCIPVIFWWTSSCIYIYSMGTPTYD